MRGSVFRASSVSEFCEVEGCCVSGVVWGYQRADHAYDTGCCPAEMVASVTEKSTCMKIEA